MTEVHLDPDGMDTQIRDGFCLSLLVQDPESLEYVYAYLDTSEEQLLYDPRTYTGPNSNTSVLMQFEEQSPSVFRISNHVIPSAVLMPANRTFGTRGIEYNINFNPGATVNFVRLYDRRTMQYAFFTLINNNPEQRAYLMPVIDTTQQGQRRKTIRAVVTEDQQPGGKYNFFVDPTGIRQ